MRMAILALVTVAVLVVSFIWLKPGAQEPDGGLNAAQAQTHEFSFVNGQRQTGPEVIVVRQGAELILNVESDQDDVLHLHGYDMSLHMHQSFPALMRFTADFSGRFELELHSSESTVAAIEVHP